MKSRQLLHLLTGPTAVGKTELALRWAEMNDAEIVSCDSLLFYRGMDIGTAKPTREELARVRHHCVDVAEPSEALDVQRYTHLARAAVEDVLRRGKRVLVVGGSGFYLKTFWAPVADGVEVSPELRASVSTELEKSGLGALVEKLKGLNPDGLGELDVANPRRVTRALERCLASGQSLAAMRTAFDAQSGAFPDFEVELCRLERAPVDLDQRIEARVRAMLNAGLVDEVRRLVGAGLQRNRSAAQAIGYREVLAVFEGKLKEAELLPEIVRNTRALVKKQRTWFRNQLLEGHRVVDAASAKVEQLFPSAG